MGVKSARSKGRATREKKKKPSHLFLLLVGAFSHHPPARTQTHIETNEYLKYVLKEKGTKYIQHTFLIFHISMFSSWSSPMDAILFLLRARLVYKRLSRKESLRNRNPSLRFESRACVDFCADCEKKKFQLFFTRWRRGEKKERSRVLNYFNSLLSQRAKKEQNCFSTTKDEGNEKKTGPPPQFFLSHLSHHRSHHIHTQK